MVSVEYLLPFNTEHGICKNIDAFNSLIASNSNFQVNGNEIIYKGSRYSYSVTLSVVENQECTVFHVILSIGRATRKFREMLRAFRKTIAHHVKNNIQTIWDDVSFDRAKKLYPKIYLLENSLRRLISKFMLVNLGLGWDKKSVPNDVKQSIKTDSNISPHSILYEVDFIQLANFLFKPYPIKDITTLPSKLKEIIADAKITESESEELLQYIPINNWNRYFSEVVDIESNELHSKLNKLYEVRCKVAHNNLLTLDDFNNANKICDELGEVIEAAMENLNSIEIPEEERESISLRTGHIRTRNEDQPTSSFDFINPNDNLSEFDFKNIISNRILFPIEIIDNKLLFSQDNLFKKMSNNYFSLNLNEEE